MTNKVFLGGTCANSTWRDELTPRLDVDVFNPVVEDWTLEDQVTENYEKDKLCNIHLYVITNAMKGVYSIAEVMDSATTPGKFTILHILPQGFDKTQLKSLQATVDLVRSRGGIAYIDEDINRTVRVINNCFTINRGYEAI